MRLLVIAVCIGALLDVGVFAYQLNLNTTQSKSINRGDCWFAVLDQAVLGHHTRAELVRDAQLCARLPHP